MRIAITGSSGLIGTALREHFAAGGHEVVRVQRGAIGDFPVVWQPSEGWIQDGALEGCDAVVHLTGASIGEKRWSGSRKRLLRDSRTQPTRALVDHIGTLSQKPRVLVCASGVNFYGNRGDEVMSEDSPRGDGFLAELVEDWEAEVQRAEAYGVRVVSMRNGVVLSAKGGALPRMLTPFKLGVGGRLGSGRQWMSWIALEDEVRAIGWAIEHEDLRGPVNSTSPNPVTNSEFTRALGRQLHRPTVFPIPGFAIRLLFGQMGQELLLDSMRVVPDRLVQSGFTFQHPEVDGALAAALGKPVRPAPSTLSRVA